MNSRGLLFIPMYNCGPQIARTLAKIGPKAQSLFMEVLAVDNRSGDDTIANCIAAMAGMRGTRRTLVRNVENFNLGGSHKIAFLYAMNHEFDFVVVLHGDDQGCIDDILPLIERAEFEPYDCVLGARFMPGARLVNYSFLRMVGNIVMNLIFSIVLGRMIYDLGAGLNLYTTRFLRNKQFLRFPDALTFNYHMLVYTIKSNATFRFVPITWSEKDQVSNVRLFQQSKRLLALLADVMAHRFVVFDDAGRLADKYRYDLLFSREAGA